MEKSQSKNQFITYLLGAGASVGALPIVEEYQKRLENFRNEISGHLSKNEPITQRDIGKEKRPQLIQDLDWLIENTKNHASVDTFAKKLYIKGGPEKGNLIKLKKLLSLFFIYEQIDKVDKRYDSFIASIIHSTKEISNRIRIISWNYDYQFEKAYSDFFGSGNLDIIQEIFSVSPSPEKEKPDPILINNPDSFRIVKLNGTTAFNDISESEIRNLANDLNDKTTFRNNIESHYNNKNLLPLISFAWEDYTKTTLNEVKSIASQTQAVVVIGYSFPFFNREIDKQIFELMNCKKIYVQDKYPEKIKATLSGIIKKSDKWEIETLSFTEQFFLPYEL